MDREPIKAQRRRYFAHERDIIDSGNEQKLVIQSVNMMLEGAFLGKWDQDDRISRMIMIGRKLDANELDSGFQSCQQGNEA